MSEKYLTEKLERVRHQLKAIELTDKDLHNDLTGSICAIASECGQVVAGSICNLFLILLERIERLENTRH